MNDNAKKWVAALRSGEYQQGREYLNRDGKMCCLGVACEVAVGLGLKMDIVKYGGGTSYDGEFCSLPKPVAEFFGLSSTLGEVKGGRERALYYLNDTGATFGQIANYVESEPEGLFLKGAP